MNHIDALTITSFLSTLPIRNIPHCQHWAQFNLTTFLLSINHHKTRIFIKTKLLRSVTISQEIYFKTIHKNFQTNSFTAFLQTKIKTIIKITFIRFVIYCCSPEVDTANAACHLSHFNVLGNTISQNKYCCKCVFLEPPDLGGYVSVFNAAMQDKVLWF